MNPYESPDFSDAYKPNWTLVKRCALWFSVLLIALLFINATLAWGSYQPVRQYEGDVSPVEKLSRFFFDWKKYEPHH